MRAHLYLLAHRIFPRDTLKEPNQVFQMLTGPEAGMFCAMQWDKAGSLLPPDQRMPYPGLSVRRVEGVPNTEAVAVMFPEPDYMSEAYFALIAKRPGGTPGYFILERGDGRAFWASYRRSPMGVMRARGGTMSDKTPEAVLREIAGDLDLIMGPHEGGLENLDMLLPLRPPVGAVKVGPGGKVKKGGCLGKLALAGLVLAALAIGAIAFWALFVQPMPRGPDKQVARTKTVKAGKPFKLAIEPDTPGKARYSLWVEAHGDEAALPDMAVTLSCRQKGQKPRKIWYGNDLDNKPAGVQRRYLDIYRYPGSSGRRARSGFIGTYAKDGGEIRCKGKVDTDGARGRKLKLIITANQRYKDMLGIDL